jgi:hypothetical protein
MGVLHARWYDAAHGVPADDPNVNYGGPGASDDGPSLVCSPEDGDGEGTGDDGGGDGF